MDIEALRTEDQVLEAIIEYYLKTYFSKRREAIREVYKLNPAFINKEYSFAQLDAEIDELIIEVKEKVNKSLLLVLDLYSLGYRREVREFESDFVDLLNEKVLSKLSQAIHEVLSGVTRIF